MKTIKTTDYIVNDPILNGGVKYYPVSCGVTIWPPQGSNAFPFEAVEYFTTRQEAEQYCKDNSKREEINT